MTFLDDSFFLSYGNYRKKINTFYYRFSFIQKFIRITLRCTLNRWLNLNQINNRVSQWKITLITSPTQAFNDIESAESKKTSQESFSSHRRSSKVLLSVSCAVCLFNTPCCKVYLRLSKKSHNNDFNDDDEKIQFQFQSTLIYQREMNCFETRSSLWANYFLPD